MGGMCLVLFFKNKPFTHQCLVPILSFPEDLEKMKNDMNDADTYREKHTTAFGSGQLRTVCTSAPYFV